MFIDDGCDALNIRTHLMFTFMKAVAAWVATITVLACTNGSTEDASCSMSSIACIHGSKTATILTALTP